MIFLGVDIGTTRTKVLAYDTTSGPAGVTGRPTPVLESPIGDLRDADAVLRTVVDALGDTVAALTPEQRERVAGVGVTSLSEEVVLLRRDGSPLGPMPTWYNQSAGRAAAAEAGLDPSFSWAKLRWAFDELGSASGAFPGATPSDVAVITTLSGYVVDRLAGAGAYAVDHSHASRTGFFGLREARWSVEDFERTGWPASALPPLVPTGSTVGPLDPALAGRMGLPVTTSVVIAGHDHFCGAYGIGVRGDGELYVSAGTSEAHCLIVDELPDGPLPAEVGVGRFVDGERFYLHRQLPSGHLYRHWRGLLGLTGQTPEEESAALAAHPVGSQGAVLVPGVDTDTRSWLLGLGTDADGSTVLRALFEGLGCAAREIDAELMSISGRAVTSVMAAGLPCASPVWQEIRAHLSPAPMWVSAETEAPALGAAQLAQRAVTGDGASTQPSTSLLTTDDGLVAYRAVYERFLTLAGSVIR